MRRLSKGCQCVRALKAQVLLLLLLLLPRHGTINMPPNNKQHCSP
jgi:hypothetical protein